VINTLLRPEADAPCLALRRREAAKALGVSDRTLWSWTQQGIIPHVRQGKTVLYPMAVLVRWLDERAKVNATAADEARPQGGDHDPR
jgi:excisionase family DNA binding protein